MAVQRRRWISRLQLASLLTRTIHQQLHPYLQPRNSPACRPFATTKFWYVSPRPQRTENHMSNHHTRSLRPDRKPPSPSMAFPSRSHLRGTGYDHACSERYRKESMSR